MDVTLELLLQKSKGLEKLMAEAARETDPERLTAIAEKVSAEAKALEALGKQYQAEEQRRVGRRGFVEVVLTPEQRRRIQDQTGVLLETVVLPDESGAQSQAMPMSDPRIIEQLALHEAGRRKLAAEADAITRREVARVIAELEAQNNAALNEELEKLKRDPNFVGNLVNKK
jgi:hypothetical protein